MVVSPLALAATLVGLAKVVRRLDVSPRVLRYEKTTDRRRHLGHGGLLHRRRHVGVRRRTGPAQPLPHRGDRPDRPRRHRVGLGGERRWLSAGWAAPPASSPPAEPGPTGHSGVDAHGPGIPNERDTSRHTRWSRRKILTVGLGAAAGIVIAGAAGVELVSHGVLPGQQELESARGRLLGHQPQIPVRGTRAFGLGLLPLPGPPPCRRLHHRLAPRSGARHSPAAHRHAARQRREPHRRVERPAAGRGGGARRRRASPAADGHGHGRRRRRLLEPPPRRRPDGHGRLRAHPPVPGHEPRPGPTEDRHHGHLNGWVRGDPPGGEVSRTSSAPSPPSVPPSGPRTPRRRPPTPPRTPPRRTSPPTTPSATPRRSRTRPSAWRRATTTRSTPAFWLSPGNCPKTSTVVLSQGCHTGPFFNAQEPPSLQFLGRHLAH